jgi:hypothetical protein
VSTSFSTLTVGIRRSFDKLRTNLSQYHRSRVIVEHRSQPWKLSELSSLTGWDLTEDRTNRDYDYLVEKTTSPVGGRARAPKCECLQCKAIDSIASSHISATFSDYDDIDPTRASGLSEHQCLICMSHMFSFVLSDRTYGIVS